MAQAVLPPAAKPDERHSLDRGRYRRVVFTFGLMFLNVLWWEVVLRAVAGPRLVARGRSQRIRRYARRFRRLAVGMGGVLIKLGQFVSARVDVMPPEIVEELAGLQDEVPPEPIDVMMQVIEAELGEPADVLYDEFETQVQAAASLGQVYRARLADGSRVAVKIQRPGIERLVATDLRALQVVAGWAMLWSVVRKRADVPALLDEFAATLWQELDYESEADHARRFRELFADDVRVYIPRIYPELSTRCVLTMEDVTSIKIVDRAAIDAAGVDRPTAARRLLDLYLQMIFEFGFFHADPHPGNLFVYPLPPDAAQAMYGDSVPHPGRPFYIIFVDFGMVGYVNERVMGGLREALIAIGTRDTSRMLRAYQQLGVLLPGADVERVQEAEVEVLDMIWGRSVQEIARMPREEMRAIAMRYGDLLYKLPFQVPQNFIYLGRAVGILSGICTLLDPDFNPWEQVARYAERAVAREARGNLGELAREALSLGGRALSLPQTAQEVLNRLQRGEISVRVTPDDELHKDLLLVEGAITGLTRAVLTGSLVIAGGLLYTSGETVLGLTAFGFACLAWLTVAFRRKRRR
ncbi:MAG TPA: AarF/UbiB family protein [Aggregatilineales bacterium]|nr:AarF/UbiB family protein [Aggregatilineales bacterium]